MPEDELPFRVTKGSLEHILFITLTVSIDYQRDADKLWKSSRETYNDVKTRYLFDPKSLAETTQSEIIDDMKKHNLSKKRKKDAWIWQTVGVTFYKKWKGNPINFLEFHDWDSCAILEHLKTDSHNNRGKPVHDYPYLRGDKIGPLWIRMLRDNAEMRRFRNLGKIPIPVDVHVARATFATGVIRGQLNSNLGDVYDQIRKAWRDSVSVLKSEGYEMIPLELDRPLWRLSKDGCSKDRKNLEGICSLNQKCPVREYCVPGKLEIIDDKVVIDT